MAHEMKKDLPIIPFASFQEWEAWLNENHTSAPGLWVKLAKKKSGIPSLTYAEAVDGGLIYGWIDSQKASYDEDYWLQRFTPRRPKSKWSQNNRERIEELIAEGRMEPAGLREVEAAKEDGRWDAAYAPQSTAELPEDFQKKLDEHPRARAFWDSLNSANRYAILYQIQDAKRPETRTRRIDKFVSMLEEGKKLY